MNASIHFSILAFTLSISRMDGALSSIAIDYEGVGTNRAVLAWDASPGKSYFLFATSSLDQPWSALNPRPIFAVTNHVVYEDSNISGMRFYRVLELSSAVQVSLMGTNAQYWQASDVWVPATQSITISGSNALITLGAWWDGNNVATLPPTDTNGLFVSAVPVKFSLYGYPVQVQVTCEINASAGGHLVTPAAISGSGDGYFLLAQVPGLSSGSPVRDSGYATNWHAYYGFNDPNSIQAITVTTDGNAAQIGDLAVAIFVMDNESNPNIDISLPAGWTSLGFNNNATDNIGYRACYKIVSAAGRQSVTCSWTDDSTYIAAGAIAVFGRASNP